MNIISLINGKGGCGKSTLAIHLARGLQLANKKKSVLLIDADPQGTVRDWNNETRDPFNLPVVAMDRGDIKKDVLAVGSNYDWIVIDTSGHIEKQTASVLLISDLVLIPVQPSPNDFWAASPVVSTIKQRQEIADGRPAAAFVVNRSKKGTKLTREADVIADYGLPIIDGFIGDRTSIPSAMSRGLTVFDKDTSGGQATWEFEHLIKQVMGAFK